MPPKLNWSDVTVLLAFGRTGSLAASAIELGIDETTAARRLKRLEQGLGTALTTRDGGKLRLSDAGRAALERAHGMERAASHLAGLSSPTSDGATGSVTLTTLMYVFNQLIVPSMPTFLASHPKIELLYLADNRSLDLTKFEADVALRVAAPSDPNVDAEKLCDLAFALYRPRNRFAGVTASRCDWIGPHAAYSHVPEAQWLEQHIPRGRYSLCSNSTSSNLALVKAGVGCAILPACIADHDRDLVRLQPDPVLHRELWLLTRAATTGDSAVGQVRAWVMRLFAEIGPALAR